MIAATRAQLKDGEQPCIALVMDEESALILCRLVGNHLLGPGLSKFADQTYNALYRLCGDDGSKPLVMADHNELYVELDEARAAVKAARFAELYGQYRPHMPLRIAPVPPPLLGMVEPGELRRAAIVARRQIGGNDEAGPGVARGPARPVQG